MDRGSQKAYLDAVKCLTTKPSRFNTRLPLRQYDDYQYLHATVQGQIHFVAQFLPCELFFIDDEIAPVKTITIISRVS